jgi:hypothetical protein
MTDHWERCLASAIARRAHLPRAIELLRHDSWASVIVHHKNPYSLPGFEPGTSGFVVWTSDHFLVVCCHGILFLIFTICIRKYEYINNECPFITSHNFTRLLQCKWPNGRLVYVTFSNKRAITSGTKILFAATQGLLLPANKVPVSDTYINYGASHNSFTNCSHETPNSGAELCLAF